MATSSEAATENQRNTREAAPQKARHQLCEYVACMGQTVAAYVFDRQLTVLTVRVLDPAPGADLTVGDSPG